MGVTASGALLWVLIHPPSGCTQELALLLRSPNLSRKCDRMFQRQRPQRASSSQEKEENSTHLRLLRREILYLLVVTIVAEDA